MRSSPLLRRVGAAPSRALVVAAMLVLLGTSLAPAQVQRTSAATCSLVPQLRDVTINQGLGAYTPLVRGKETLVRWYLSLPACAASGASIRLTGAALRVTRTGLTALIGRPTPALRSPYPLLPPHRQASLLDAPGDPLFVVPGSVLAPAGTTSRFTATFRATINYSARESATATPVTGSITFTKRPGTTTAISATVERRTNALRILVVPMGDISQSYASQFTTAANSSVISGMLTLSRIFPVPQGTGDLGGSVGGVRYAINPGLLDVGRLMTGGTFCGTGSNFNAIKGLLGQYLQTWNTANPDASADRVLGVVDESISRGGSSGCAEGMASVGSAEAWVRATYDRPGTPSATGAVIAMEIAHTLGMVHGSRDDFFSPYHSPNREADPGGNRAYNVGLRSFLVDDRTVMTLSGTWNNTNTLFEAADWAQVLCALGGAATSECSSPGSVGTATGIAAGPRFILSGTVSDDETDPVTSVVESYFSLDVAPTDPDPDSRYRLVQRDETSILRDDGVPVLFTDSNHDDADEAAEHSGLGLFSLSFPFDTDAERVELWRGSPDAPGSELLYARDRTAPPEIVAVEIGPPEPTGELINFTSDASRDDVDPALTDDATWLAWSTFMGVGSSPAMQVAPTSSPGNVAVLGGADPSPASQPAWRPDARALAYVWNGDVYTVPVDTTGSVASFGVPTRIYDHLPEVNLPAFRPTWSPDGTQIAFDAAGDIYRMPATGGTPIRLTTTGDAHSPSWSRTPGDERIVYVRDLRDGAFAPESSPVVYGRMSGSGLVHRPASIDAPRPVGGSQPIAPTSHDEVTETYPVNSTDDEDDGTCDEAHCSLREAINAANAHDNGAFDQDTITFAIPGDGPYTIQPLTQLPDITDPVIIDGTTQPGYAGSPVVELDGSLAGTNVYGLDIRAGSSVVRGLTINRFTQAGIIIWFENGSLLEGNYIGTDVLGTSAQPNQSGVLVLSAANQIGTAEPGGENLISGNNGAGIEFRQATSTGNVVLGNSIGTDVTGTIALPNVGSGISSPASNTIGGPGPGEGNVISGNYSSGLSLGSANVVQGNLVGTAASGTQRLGNLNGIDISGSNNVIGGTTAGARNVISGNSQEGMTLYGTATINNQVEGNYIGTDIAGTVALGNGPGNRGISVGFGARDNVIGGTADGAGNVISGNRAAGVYIFSSTTSGIRVQGNLIGTNASGTASLRNGTGVYLFNGAHDNVIGGTAAGSGNVISGNIRGVEIDIEGTSGNVVLGNRIGTNSSGSMALSNVTGIRIDGASGNTIGGTSPGAGNVISGNDRFGLEVRGSNTIVQGNLIGTDGTGTVDLGNGFSGVGVYGANNTVGGAAAGAGNTIAFNSARGVYVFGEVADGNRILGNSIFSNELLGIDLAIDADGASGVTPNDPGDLDTGPNDLQNFPVLDEANETTIAGTLDSEPSTSYRLEFFSNDACDGSDHGEGQTYLSSTDVTTNADGNASFTATAPVVLDGFIAATATDPDGNTSEFSRCLEADAPSGTGTRDLWTLDPDSPATSQAELVADGVQPWWSQERIAFERDGAIWTVAPDGDGEATVTEPPDDSAPSLSGGLLAFQYDNDGQQDVMLLRLAQPVTVTVQDDNPEDVRLDLILECPDGFKYPIAVAITPDQVDGASAEFTANYDPSAGCEGGMLVAVVSDGFHRVPSSQSLPQPATESKPPVSAISGPLIGSEYLQFQNIPLHGSGRDAEDGDLTGTSLTWILDGRVVGSAGQLDLSPPAGGWSRGIHTLVLRVTDAEGNVTEIVRTFTILADADNDGLSRRDEGAACFSRGDRDPTNAFADYDGDGIPNVDDPEPCTAAATYEATAVFLPDPMRIRPPGTEPPIVPHDDGEETVLVRIRLPYRAITEVRGLSVRLSTIAGIDVSGDARFRNVEWRVRNGVGTALFDGAAMARLFHQHGIRDHRIVVGVTGRSQATGASAWTFTASAGVYVQEVP